MRAAGMDTKLGESGAHLVEVYLGNSFAHGDGLWARYVSATLAKFEDCKVEAALGLWVLLLANRPNGVHLHGSAPANITRVRERARRLHQAALVAPCVPAGTLDMSGRWPVIVQSLGLAATSPIRGRSPLLRKL